jgi:hypothetical protein
MLCQNCNEIGALLSEIGGPERTGRYIFIYIDVEESRPPLWSSGRVPGYSSRGPGSIPGATRFSEK